MQEQTNKWRIASSIVRVAWLALPVLTVIAFIAVEAQRVAPAITIINLDYFTPVDRALVLGFRSLNGWMNPIHPVGYPWLIRVGMDLGWDAERIGQGLSIAGGVLGLCGTYLLALSVFKDKRFSALAVAFVASTSIFLYFGSIEGNDMPAAGVQILSLGLLAVSTLEQETPRSREVFLAGLVAGLAYLIRYNGMVTAMAGGLWLVMIAIFGRRRAAWKAVALYGAAFLVGSALQWVPSLIATGNPFSIDQGQNVWFHLYGKTDFINEWQQAPQGVTVFKLFAMDPVKFIQHWWSAFQGFWISPELTLLDAPLTLFAQAGFIFLLLAPGPAPIKPRGLLAIFVLGHLASLSMMRLDRRFLIVMIPILTIGAVSFFARLVPARWGIRRVVLPLNILALLVGLAWASQGLLGFAGGRPAPDWTVIQASNALHAAGMQSAQEVLSTHERLQDASVLGRERFVQAYWVAPKLESVADLVQAMRSHGWRFFIYDQNTGAAVYPALKGLLSPEAHPAELVPIYFPENRGFVIYRLEGESSEGCSPLDAHFASGIALECYEAHVSQDVPAGSGRRAGVYLKWRAITHLDSSLKVFVHLLNAQGQLVAQDDGIPVLWLYPTDAWQPGQVVVDVHEFAVDAKLPPGQYTLQAGLYDDGTGVRLNRVDAAGNSIDDKVVLSTIQIR